MNIGLSLEVGVQGDILNIQRLEKNMYSGLPFGEVYHRSRVESIPGLAKPAIIAFNKSVTLEQILIDGIMKLKK